MTEKEFNTLNTKRFSRLSESNVEKLRQHYIDKGWLIANENKGCAPYIFTDEGYEQFTGAAK